MTGISRVLLHVCCGPCTIFPLKALREEGLDVEGFFFNPNIHPYQEYLRRRDTLLEYAQMQDFSVEISPEHPFQEFIQRVADHVDARCRDCYFMRLEKTARKAVAEGYEAFTTTLLVSPFQKHDLIAEIGEEVAKKEGVSFLYRDFRPGYKSAVGRAKQLRLYRQPYCGCIYSEFERYGGKG